MIEFCRDILGASLRAREGAGYRARLVSIHTCRNHTAVSLQVSFQFRAHTCHTSGSVSSPPVSVPCSYVLIRGDQSVKRDPVHVCITLFEVISRITYNVILSSSAFNASTYISRTYIRDSRDFRGSGQSSVILRGIYRSHSFTPLTFVLHRSKARPSSPPHAGPWIFVELCAVTRISICWDCGVLISI